MSDTPLDIREQIVRIDRAIAESEKFSAETRKLVAESTKFSFENRKLLAEAAKLRRDPIVAIIAATAAVAGAFAALGGVLVKVLGG